MTKTVPSSVRGSNQFRVAGGGAEQRPHRYQVKGNRLSFSRM